MKCLFLLIVAAVLCHWSSGKGFRGGGGGFRGGYRGGYSSRASGSYRVSNLRTWSSSQKATAMTLGFVFISRRMRARYGSSSYSDYGSLQICQNEEKYKDYNGSTAYTSGWFMCPVDDESNTHCCGADGRQYCCPFWSSPASGGAIAGIVIGCLLALFVIGYIMWRCVIPKLKKQKRKTRAHSAASNRSTTPSVFTTGAKPQYPTPPPAYENYAGPDQTEPPQQFYGVYPPNGAAQSPPPPYPPAGQQAAYPTA